MAQTKRQGQTGQVSRVRQRATHQIRATAAIKTAVNHFKLHLRGGLSTATKLFLNSCCRGADR
jgi:hypothetical protein